MSHKNDGGQRRTVTLSCGKSIKGAIREVNGKVNIHRKHCDICRDAIEKDQVIRAPFNQMQGSRNGWNGIQSSRHVGNNSFNREVESTGIYNGHSSRITHSRNLTTEDMLSCLTVIESLEEKIADANNKK